MPKITPKSSKIYKPEILVCPHCGADLKYWYTVSDKTIQFTSGKWMRIVNMGYACPICKDEKVYFSQTANKFCLKGCTYSVKTLCMIDYYKKQHMGREGICSILSDKGFEISDRNVDILYKKIKKYIDLDYDAEIKQNYEAMLAEYHQIRLCVDLITIEKRIYVPMYNFFTGEMMALFQFDGIEDPNIGILKEYINDTLPITYIFTVRPNVSRFYSLLKSMVSKNTTFMSFAKF